MVLNDVLCARPHGGPNHDLARLRCRLQAGCGVDSVAGEHAIAGPSGTLNVDQDLAGLYADAHGQRRLAFGREAAVQLGEDRLHLEANADRPFRVVFVGLGDTEDRQDGVAHELLEESLVALDLLRQPVKGAPND